PGYSINRQQALDGWTVNNARLMQWDGIGALKSGYRADLAIVDRNPQTCNIGDLPNTQVLRTVLGGDDIFDTNTLPRLSDSELPPERIRQLERGSASDGSKHVCGSRCSHPAH
ncbi:amidohydrolase family protein, partial [Bradyrhizobium sp. 24]|nr:amidohydrolase family protein [Bradyrhizobium sp. 24]